MLQTFLKLWNNTSMWENGGEFNHNCNLKKTSRCGTNGKGHSRSKKPTFYNLGWNWFLASKMVSAFIELDGDSNPIF